MGIEWREITPCPRWHLGRQCEGESGHDGDHWITIWAVTQSDDGEWETCPSHPEYWSETRSG